MYALMHVCALMYVRTNVKSDAQFKYIYINIYIYNYIYVYIRTYGSEVCNRSFTQVWNGRMERGYGTGVVPDLVPDIII